MKTVYAVVTGEYSDYSVHAIFTDKADALAHMEAVQQASEFGSESAQVQEFAFFEPGELPQRRELWIYVTGGGFKEKASSAVFWDYEASVDSWDASEGRVGAVGPTLEQAKKAAQDRAARRLAEQHGVG